MTTKMTENTKSKLNTYSPFRGSLLPTSIFDDIFRETEDIFTGYKSAGVPYNVVQGEKSTRIEVALAGYDKSDIKVKVVDNEMQISAEHKTTSLNEGEQYAHKGIAERSVQLKFRITSAANVNNIKSTFTNGLLAVTIPAQDKSVVDVNID